METEAWFKIVNPEKQWDVVPLSGIKYVAHLKKAIKKESSKTLGSYDTSDLSIKAKKDRDDDDSTAVELNGTSRVSSVFKRYGSWLLVSVPYSNRGPQKSEPESEDAEVSKRPPKDAEKPSKKFMLNSTVHKRLRKSVYYADQTDNNAPLIDKIKSGAFVRMYGPQASGKSSRVVDAMTELRSNGYECIGIDLQPVDVSSEQSFWRDLNTQFKPACLPSDFEDAASFLDCFKKNSRWTRPVVIFLDEFDVLLSDKAKEACSSMMGAAHPSARADNGDDDDDVVYMIHSIVCVGTFAITLRDQNNFDPSPFNAIEGFSGVSLTKEQVRCLFQEFGNDYKITIDPLVIDDIFQLTAGHAGLVNVCGTEIQHILPLENEKLTPTCWQTFIPSLMANVTGYSTFRNMIDLLLQRNEAVDCLRTHFLGHFDDFVSCPANKKPQADFLTTLGILTPNETGSKFRVISPLIDSLIRPRVISAIYPLIPSTLPPREYEGGPLDFLAALKASLKTFDKDLISRAASHSYKAAKVQVDGHRRTWVPRDSVYDSDLTRIMASWLKQIAYTVTGKWHQLDSHRYSSIVINKAKSTIVVEVLATAGSGLIREQIERIREYKGIMGAQEAWVVHFTREDDYLEGPYWQADEVVEEGVNMVHVWHNLEFTEVRMSIKSKGVLVEDERVF